MLEQIKRCIYTLLSPVLFGVFFSKYSEEKENTVLFYPVFDDLQELVHHYRSAGHFLPPDAKVIFVVSQGLKHKVKKVRDSAAPDYMGDCLRDVEQEVVFEPARESAGLLKLLLKYRPVSILLWRCSNPNRFFGLALESSLVHNVDRYSTWGCYSYPSFRHGLRSRSELKTQRSAMQRKFLEYVESLPVFSKVYVFGTGPSIERAFGHDFSDGYRIVCNTMIKNAELMEQIKPHFMVAGDGIYHFGVSRYACRFRRDLERFLSSHRCLLILPEGYYDNFLYHNENLAEFTLPVPYTARRTNLRMKEVLETKFQHNILNQLLLPLASSLCDNIFLLGFDGRKADDQHFWKSADSVNYEDLKVHHQKAHPGFFSGVDYPQYANLQSECAEKIISLGERMGKKYYCMNESSNAALQRRLRVNAHRENAVPVSTG